MLPCLATDGSTRGLDLVSSRNTRERFGAPRGSERLLSAAGVVTPGARQPAKGRPRFDTGSPEPRILLPVRLDPESLIAAATA